MSFDYDALYATTPDAPGPPDARVVAAFDKLDGAARGLDLGCGQGRDALFLTGRGQAVTALDLSPAGVVDVVRLARAEGLPVDAAVADICDHAPDGTFDVALIGRTLHMLDRADRLVVLARMQDHVVSGGWLVIGAETRNLPDFRKVLARSGEGWAIMRDGRGLFVARRE